VIKFPQYFIDLVNTNTRYIPPLPKNPIVDEVIKLTQQLPYDYDTVYGAWLAGCRTIEDMEKYFGFR
jgi:hypothetical protein